MAHLDTEVQRNDNFSPEVAQSVPPKMLNWEKAQGENAQPGSLGKSQTNTGLMLKMKWVGLLPKVSQHFKTIY